MVFVAGWKMLIEKGKKFFFDVSADFFIERGLKQIIFFDLFFEVFFSSCLTSVDFSQYLLFSRADWYSGIIILNPSKLHKFFDKRDEIIWVNCFFILGD